MPPSALYHQNVAMNQSVTLKTQPPPRPLSLPPIPNTVSSTQFPQHPKNYPHSLNPFDDKFEGPPQIEADMECYF